MDKEIYEHTNSRGATYYLNTKVVTLRGDKQYQIYYFSKDRRTETGCALPDGYEVHENERNGFLVVRRIKKD